MPAHRMSATGPVLATFALLAAGCMQIPENVKMVNNAVVRDGVARFERCGASVIFTGSPELLSKFQAIEMTRRWFNVVNWEVDALVFSKYQLAEIAVCACADHAFSESALDDAGRSARSDPKVHAVATRTEPGMRTTLSIERDSQPLASHRVREVMRLPESDRRCVFTQFAVFPISALQAHEPFSNSFQSLTAATTSEPAQR